MHENYLRDLGTLLIEAAWDAKRQLDELRDNNRRDYVIGRLMAYHEVISLMQKQAEAFGIPFSEIGLDAIDPETDLL